MFTLITVFVLKSEMPPSKKKIIIIKLFFYHLFVPVCRNCCLKNNIVDIFHLFFFMTRLERKENRRDGVKC